MAEAHAPRRAWLCLLALWLPLTTAAAAAAASSTLTLTCDDEVGGVDCQRLALAAAAGPMAAGMHIHVETTKHVASPTATGAVGARNLTANQTEDDAEPDTQTRSLALSALQQLGERWVLEHVQVRVIALSDHDRWPQAMRAKREAEAMGFKAVGWVHATDLRNASALRLLNDDVISLNAYVSLTSGKKRWHEIGSLGAVGNFLSHLRACSTENPTLVLEADARLGDTLLPKLAEALRTRNLDTVQFGPHSIFDTSPDQTPIDQSPDDAAEQGSWLQPLGDRSALGTHGILYTPRGCARVRKELGNKPIDVQYDDAIGFLARTLKRLDAFIETEPRQQTESPAADAAAAAAPRPLSAAGAAAVHSPGVHASATLPVGAGKKDVAKSPAVYQDPWLPGRQQLVKSSIDIASCPLCNVPAQPLHAAASATHSVTWREA